MKKILTIAWWKAAGERALSQAAEAILPLVALQSLLDTNWTAALGVGIGGALASLLFSIAQLPEAVGKAIPAWQAYAWRLGRTIAAAAVGVLGTTAFDVFAFDWTTALNAIAATVIVAVLKMTIAPTPAEGRDNGGAA